jgi:hypothetical protein
VIGEEIEYRNPNAKIEKWIDAGRNLWAVALIEYPGSTSSLRRLSKATESPFKGWIGARRESI